jgi:LysR family hydrogen peroxide-inducible transcriptional activator
LHTLDLKDSEKARLKQFSEPKPAREVSLIFPKSQLKMHIIDALRSTIAGVVKGAITFQDVKIISPKSNKTL